MLSRPSLCKKRTNSSTDRTLSIKKEGNILFYDAINTFYLWLYGVRHVVKDRSDSERGNPLLPHGLLFPSSSKGSFYMHHPTDRIPHTTAFVTPVMEHWLEREIALWIHHEGSIWPLSIMLPWLRCRNGKCFTSPPDQYQPKVTSLPVRLLVHMVITQNTFTLIFFFFFLAHLYLQYLDLGSKTDRYLT